MSVACVETAGSFPNVQNTTVDLANRRANINIEQGEWVTCTFTSEPIVPTAALASISGRVVNDRGAGLKGIKLSVLNANTGVTKNATTNSFGYYNFTGLPVTDYYVVTAQPGKGYRISNNTRSFTLEADLAGLDFTAER